MKIKDWFYLLFRPKWERRLYKLLRRATQDDRICLDAVLFDYSYSNQHRKGRLLKPALDAMMFYWVGIYDVRITAPKTYNGQYLRKITFREYLKKIAQYFENNATSQQKAHIRYLLKDVYFSREDRWISVLVLLNKVFEQMNLYRVDDIYEDGFAMILGDSVNLKTEILKSLNLPDVVDTRINNWAVLSTYCAYKVSH